MERRDPKRCGVPMALCNDNMWGYSTDFIVKPFRRQEVLTTLGGVLKAAV